MHTVFYKFEKLHFEGKHFETLLSQNIRKELANLKLTKKNKFDFVINNFGRFWMQTLILITMIRPTFKTKKKGQDCQSQRHFQCASLFSSTIWCQRNVTAMCFSSDKKWPTNGFTSFKTFSESQHVVIFLKKNSIQRHIYFEPL